MSEFNMLQTTLGVGEREELAAVDGPSIVIATKGGAKVEVDGDDAVEMREGMVWFVAQGTEVSIEAGGEGFLVYVAFVE
jgi:mannose-6-phosphate isomerase